MDKYCGAEYEIKLLKEKIEKLEKDKTEMQCCGNCLHDLNLACKKTRELHVRCESWEYDYHDRFFIKKDLEPAINKILAALTQED